MNWSGCRRGRLSLERLRRSVDGRNDLVLGGAVGDAGEGHPAGMALERCVELDAVLFAAGGGDLQFLVRSERGAVPRNRWRTDMGGVSFCGGSGAQPDLGARVAEPGT